MSAVNYSEGSKQSDPIERIKKEPHVSDMFVKEENVAKIFRPQPSNQDVKK